jgi:hypothetical protein
MSQKIPLFKIVMHFCLFFIPHDVGMQGLWNVGPCSGAKGALHRETIAAKRDEDDGGRYIMGK